MRWFKLWTEARNDAKLRSLSADLRWSWFCILCYAAEQSVRGTIQNPPRLLAAEICGGDVTELKRVCNELVTIGLLQVERFDDSEVVIVFPSFEKRQRKAPSDEPDRVKDRVAKHRRKKTYKDKQKKRACNESETTRIEICNGEAELQSNGRKVPKESPPPNRFDEEDDPDLEPFHCPPVMVRADNPPLRTGQDMVDWNAAVKLLRSQADTEPLAGSMEMNAEDGEVLGLEGWQFLQAARVVQQPGKGTGWKFFLGCARAASVEEFDAYNLKMFGNPKLRAAPEPVRLPQAPANSPFWAIANKAHAHIRN
jgi:hypothetical protein